MMMQWLASIHCQNHDIYYLRYVCICVLECILCLCYDLWPMQFCSGSCPIFFKVLTLNVAIVAYCHFCCLSSVADFSNTEARASTLAGRAPFLPALRAMRVEHVV